MEITWYPVSVSVVTETRDEYHTFNGERSELASESRCGPKKSAIR